MRSLLCRAVAGAALLGTVAVASLGAQAAERDDNTGFGTTSAEFLLLGAGARGAALGNSFAAIATDPTALYWNPAGVAEMMRPGFSFSTYTYVADSRYSWGGVAFPFNDGQSAIGLQFGTFGFAEQPVYTLAAPDGDGTTYSVSETFAGVTYAQNFSDRFSAGITGKFISDKIAQSNAQGFAVDFGASFHALIAEKPIRASFVVANLGSQLQHQGTGLDVNVNRPPVPGETSLPQDPQPARYQTVQFGLPVV
ncbi:MAG: PorV/PorQ family protein, partial [Gemmatimonadales bacterium]